MDNDIAIVYPMRTAVTRAGRGPLKDTPPDALLAPVLKRLLERSNLDPTLVGDVIIGKVLGASSQGAAQVRMACLLAGIPEQVPCQVVNRQCSSGLQAIATAAACIRAGMYECAIAGGVESMTIGAKGMSTWEGPVNPEAAKHAKARGCLLPMGITNENVAEKFGISRAVQDRVALESQRRAAEAQREGRFKEEIVPVTVRVQDAAKKQWSTVVVERDDGVRPTSAEGLAALKPAFKQDGSGTTTAGNASQTSDGAAACLVMTRALANKLNLPIAGVLRSFAVVGVDPSIMGVGPAYAIPEAVKRAGISLADVGLFEINEAFAAQFAYCVDKLAIDHKKVNVNGGAIALGHPLGCTGARATATLLHEMKRRGERYGIVSMCIGTGMGAAAVFEVDQ